MHQISTRRKILYSTLLIAVTMVLCEGALRARAWVRYGSFASSVRDPMITYDPAADLYGLTPGYEIKGARLQIKINSLGFRGEEFSRQKPPGTVRIAVLGASTTFNAEVSSNDATWPHRLQEKLRAAYPERRIEVVNAAVGGYVSDDNLKNLRHKVLPLAPDLVIYYEANNEIVRDTRELALRQGLIDGSGRSAITTTLSKYSLLFDLAHKNLTILAGEAGGPARKLDAVPDDLPNRFVSHLEEMRQELDRRRIPFMLSTFIVKYRRGQDRPTQIANADVAFYYMPWMSIDGMLNAMDRYNRAILDYAAQKNLAVVDDREAIPGTADYFTDCMHLGDKGAEAMADRFFRYMRASHLIEGLGQRPATVATR